MQFVSFRFILFVSPPAVWESERMADDLENRLNGSPKLLCCFTTREREREMKTDNFDAVFLMLSNIIV
jgi:hypothetical protein